MELHILTPLTGSPTLDPLCLAAAWVCSMSAKDIKIIPSGNFHLSPTKSLPVLLDPHGEPVSGFVEIAAKVLDRELDPIELALVAYLQQLTAITQYLLFIIPENYEAVTRPEISDRVAFPMQYNAALSLQRQAQAAQPPKLSTREGPKVEAVNKLHEDMLKQHELRSKMVNSSQKMMSLISRFSEIVDTALPLLAEQPTDGVASLLLSANLVLVSLGALPLQPLKSAVEQREELVKLLRDGVLRNLQLRVDETPAHRQYTLSNTLKVYAQEVYDSVFDRPALDGK